MNLAKLFGRKPAAVVKSQSQYEAARQPQRTHVWRYPVAQDTRKSVDAYSHRQLVALGRQLTANVPAVRGAIQEKALYSVGNAWLPIFRGADKQWGDKATAWLAQWFGVCDVRGQPYDFTTGLFTDSLAIDRDGDVLVILTETANGYPQIQSIPAHRIGQRSGSGIIESGRFKGYYSYNGCIVNDAGRVIAYNILGATEDKDEIKDGFNALLLYEPEWSDQERGISHLASCILDAQDFQDIQSYLKTQAKLDATESLQVYNQNGAADLGRTYLDGGNPTNNASEAGIDVQMETLEGGAIRYFKANSGDKIEALNPNRPGQNTTEFLEKLLRNANQGLGWSYDLSRDGSKIGGATTRLVVAKCSRTVSLRQATLRKKATRCVSYAIAKAIKLKLLAPNPDWFKWDFAMPPTLTCDAGYTADENRNDVASGLRSRREDFGERGLDWRTDGREQLHIEADDLVDRGIAVAERAKERGYEMSLEFAINLIEKQSSNPPQQAMPQPSKEVKP